MKVKTNKILEHNNWSFVEQSIMNLNKSGIFVSFCDSYFIENNIPILEPWYGIIHNPIGWEKYTPWGLRNNLFNTDSFINSLEFCKILFVMAKNQVDPTIKLLQSLGFTNIKVISIIHPINEFIVCKFDFNKYVLNKNKTIYSIGNWLRKQYTIFKLKCNKKFNKTIIPFSERTKKELDYYLKFDNIHLSDIEIDSVNKIEYMEQEVYGKIFEDNLIFLDVYLTTINNTFLEAVISNTPIILNRKQEYIDLIGPEYPLFFDDIKDINSFIETDENILRAHNYLKKIDKTKFSFEYFIENIQKYLD